VNSNLHQKYLSENTNFFGKVNPFKKHIISKLLVHICSTCLYHIFLPSRSTGILLQFQIWLEEFSLTHNEKKRNNNIIQILEGIIEQWNRKTILSIQFYLGYSKRLYENPAL
jgi:hypothetical protein